MATVVNTVLCRVATFTQHRGAQQSPPICACAGFRLTSNSDKKAALPEFRRKSTIEVSFIMHANSMCGEMQQGRCSVCSYEGMRRVATPAAPRPQFVRRSRPQAVTNIAEISRIERAAADPAAVKTTNRPKARLVHV